MRVRPYVSLPNRGGSRDEYGIRGWNEGGWDRGAGSGGSVVAGVPVDVAAAAEAGVGMGAGVDGGAWLDTEIGAEGGTAGRAVGRVVAACPGPSPIPAALVHRVYRRSGATFRAISSSTTPIPPSPPGSSPPPPPAHGKRAFPAVLAAAGAAVAATAVLISSEVLSGREQDRTALPDRGRPTAAIPTDDEGRSGPPSPAATHSPSSAASGVGPAGTTVRPSRPLAPPLPAPTHAVGRVTHSPGDPGDSAPPTGPVVLREGSSGPEVVELQNRLQQLALYPGYADGRFDADVRAAVARYQWVYGVQGDPEGVYGAATRASLESHTSEP
ncbi:peptidoglycan-binding domain-containing protein [Streptomyces halobius]|uniref:Peptidoglycan-binding protein n=1 Tax=Streptomyces halobius TaxID=2879846 RepID=A0ABY4MED1_9ACTN|nr:peptidoglycan-binding domain-containing protein [Streptomyces halobius]UQA95767.1 peptidoglycan-binding protein [Streptomyces halobius]